jgi:hypothetical protein
MIHNRPDNFVELGQSGAQNLTRYRDQNSLRNPT